MMEIASDGCWMIKTTTTLTFASIFYLLLWDTLYLLKIAFFWLKILLQLVFFSNNNNNNETGNHLSKYDCLYDICWAFYVICYSYSGIQANVRYFIWRQVSVGRRIFLLKNVESKQLRLHVCLLLKSENLSNRFFIDAFVSMHLYLFYCLSFCEI